MVELGRKYECPDCEVKFYDLGRPQAFCPKCGTDLKSDVDEVRSPPPRPAPRIETKKDEAAELEVVDTDAAASDDDEDDEVLEDLDDLEEEADDEEEEEEEELDDE
jgi:hypothetical protein